MPGSINGDPVSKKRKINPSDKEQKSSERKAIDSQNGTSMAQIERLEVEIAESRRNYNNIALLISTIDVSSPSHRSSLAAAVSLCRVFVRLLSAKSFAEAPGVEEQEKVIIAWLRQRYQEYKDLLLVLLQQSDSTVQNTALPLVMRLVEQELLHPITKPKNPWTSGFFASAVPVILGLKDSELLLAEFRNKYVSEFDDIRFYTFDAIKGFIAQDQPTETLDTVIYLMSEISQVPEKVEKFYVESFFKHKDPVRSVHAHKRKAQEAWLALLHTRLSLSQRKNLLRIMSHVIAPCFLKPEMLMDFLTDSYNSGGATSLVALSGIFYLMQQRNLDYPQFYQKLYSLLDDDLLHSKHRSRFFRLLNTFLESTHLPAALVASFLKRLARLALNAPPAAIVVIVPWTYNLLKAHPSCTFMLHRAIRDEGYKLEIAEKGMEDPFDMSEPDPMATHAIESSLWELETLQSHYHPNVASIAKIMSEQFTKQAYNIEDFLDHSYQSLLDAELGKDSKKAPVVEFQIPKRIFTDRGLEEDGGKDDSLLRRLWQFS